MLKNLRDINTKNEYTSFGEAAYPAPFKQGLEYSSPARGTWNISHTGMLIPESHQIFVCPLGCLRGVVLTAAEMNEMSRYSAIEIREDNVLDGSMEQLMIEGCDDVINKLSYRPRAILLYISCQHFFLAYDQEYVFATLRKNYPDIDFIDCYMIPTLRKSGMAPDQKMRIQLYKSLYETEKNPKKVNLIGSDLPVSETSELREFFKVNGYDFGDINDCKTYDDYLAMSEAGMNLVYEPLGVKAGEDLKTRIKQDFLYIPFVFRLDEIEENYRILEAVFRTEDFDTSAYRKAAEEAIENAKKVIGDTPITVDYTFTFRPLNFARFLLENGFNVKIVYADSFLAEEENDFNWIKENHPEVVIAPTNRPQMRFNHEEEEMILSMGQKAAYFDGTDHFVNICESGGLYGFDGVKQIMELMVDAYQNPKDRKDLIQRKGFGCESCI